MAEDIEVIFESWLFKLHGSPHDRGSFNFSSPWKRRYAILCRKGCIASLHYYEKKPKSLKETPKGIISLEQSYSVQKLGKTRGKDYVCAITVGNDLHTMAASDETIFQLFVFFLRTQTTLRPELEAECFVVRPETSNDMKCLGARGNMCLMHISRYGVTLALQLSKCVLAQWPLSCIKTYETTGRGQCGLETGSRSPTGAGLYLFNMRIGQENAVFDTMDNYVNEMAGFTQMVNARTSSAVSGSDSMQSELAGLAEATQPCSDPAYIPQLKRISRDIYDHLAEHLGVSTNVASSQESSDYMRSRQVRSASADIIPSEPRPTPPSNGLSLSPSSPAFTSSPSSVHYSRTPSSSQIQPFAISAHPLAQPQPQTQPQTYPQTQALTQPPVSLPPPVPDQPPVDEGASGGVDRPEPDRQFGLLRGHQRSRSTEDLNQYARMTLHLHSTTPANYVNDAVQQSMPSVTRDRTNDVYSYATMPHRELAFRDIPTRKIAAYDYAKAFPRSLRKSVSDPDLLESSSVPAECMEFSYAQAEPLDSPPPDSSMPGTSPKKPTITPKPTAATRPTLSKGFSMSSQSRVFKKVPSQMSESVSPPSGDSRLASLALLRHQDSLSRMHGRRLPSLPPQGGATPRVLGDRVSAEDTVELSETEENEGQRSSLC